jgi:uncharacterized damage-inducible protein DinB
MRTDTPTEWDERSTLIALLHYVRATVARKCEGLTDELARQAPLPGSPLTNISSLVSHLRWVEHWWFESRFLGLEHRTPAREDDPDYEMTIGLELPLEQLLADYAEQGRRSDQIVADHPLDQVAVHAVSTGDHPTLRWIMMHMIEETARHNGHLDLLRELADGETGS